MHPFGKGGKGSFKKRGLMFNNKEITPVRANMQTWSQKSNAALKSLYGWSDETDLSRRWVPNLKNIELRKIPPWHTQGACCAST
jgi:hypothetical protein